jgi:hypothetical protein
MNERTAVGDARQRPQTVSADPSSPCVPVTTRSDHLLKPSNGGHLPIDEGLHIVGRHGVDEIEASGDGGRYWYDVRSKSRGRTEVVGFNYTWWAISILLLFLLLLPWPGWGY